MINILDSRKKNFDFLLNQLLSKRKKKINFNTKIVKKIISDIKKNEDKALLKYEKKFGKNYSIFLNSH